MGFPSITGLFTKASSYQTAFQTIRHTLNVQSSSAPIYKKGRTSALTITLFMRIKKINASSVIPVEKFQVENLSDLVVIAGPNGVGKSRLINGLLAQFQNFPSPSISFVIEATNEDEVSQWGKRLLETTNAQDRQKFTQALQKNQTRRRFKGGILYYESNRVVQNLQPLKYSWEMRDPWEENVPWNSTFSGLANRFQDTIHALYKKLQAQKSGIAAQAIKLKKQGHQSMNLDFGDPLEPFKDAFSKLLGPKQLEELDPNNQTLHYTLNGVRLSTDTLSSGEKEVLNIAFDFILRMPSDCIVFFDEPELHLHPEMTFKLISTLRSVGERNQFILCSHSPDLISSSLNDTVICLIPPNNGQNQAVVIDPTNETSAVLGRLGQSIGVIALGKKIVLVEGDENSLDKKVYSQIARAKFQNLVILPAKGKEQVASFGSSVVNVLDRTLWGIDFYLLCDRDAVPFASEAEAKLQQQARVKLLTRYHLENYFLEPEVIAAAFRNMEPEGSWQRDPVRIDERLKAIASEMIPYAVSLIVSRKLRLMVGNVDLMIGGCTGMNIEDLTNGIVARVTSEKQRVEASLDAEQVRTLTTQTYAELSGSLVSGEWKKLIPGKQIISKFSSACGINQGRFINMYLAESAQNDYAAFSDIIMILRGFSDTQAP
jgi:predicted ATPase